MPGVRGEQSPCPPRRTPRGRPVLHLTGASLSHDFPAGPCFPPSPQGNVFSDTFLPNLCLSHFPTRKCLPLKIAFDTLQLFSQGYLPLRPAQTFCNPLLQPPQSSRRGSPSAFITNSFKLKLLTPFLDTGFEIIPFNFLAPQSRKMA